MATAAITLSVIVTSWNTADLLRQCLDSLVAGSESGPDEGVVTVGGGEIADVWVVDNASEDGSPQLVVEEFPWANLLRNSENLGFARANNQGIAASRGRHVLLLNSDTIVPPGALSHLLRFFDSNPTAGVCGPQLARSDGSPQPYAFGNDPTLSRLVWRGINRLLLHRHLHDWATERVQRVDWVSGACMLLRREALEQVGRLDERFFMYFEDADLCLRIRKAGWEVFYNPDVSITHLGGRSLKKNPRARMAYQESLRYFYSKHYDPMAELVLGLCLWVYNGLSGRSRH